jgi:hypothetical protein
LIKLLNILKVTNTAIQNIRDFISSKISKFEIKYKLSIDHSVLDKFLNILISMFNKIQAITESSLKPVMDKISFFAIFIKNLFLSIYDEVVGHSYWPDTMKGISRSTDELEIVKTKLESFKAVFLKVINVITIQINGFVAKLKSAFSSVSGIVKGIDISQSLSIMGTHAGASYMAGLLYSLGSPKWKLLAISYFVSLFDVSIDSILTTLAPKLGAGFGAISGDMSANILKGMYVIFNGLLEAVPTFISTFVHAFGNIGEGLSNVLSKVTIFNNTIIHGLLLIGAAYAILAKNGTQTISDLIFGKKGKKGKNGQEGVLDYILQAFTSPKMEGAGESFFKKAFKSQKLAIIAAGIFSSALLDSVSLVEASQIGIPLLAYAIMGKDGGGRVLRNSLSLINLFIGAATTRLLGLFQLSKIPFIGSIFKNILGDPEELLSSLLPESKTVETRFSKAGKNLFESFKGMVINLRKNGEAFGKKEMSFVEAALTIGTRDITFGSLPFGKVIDKIDLKGQFVELLNAFKGTETGSVIVQKFEEIKKSFAEGYDKLTEIFNQSGTESAIIKSAKRIYSKISELALTSLTYIKVGFTGLLSFFKSQKFLFAVLLLGFGDIVFAASGAQEAVSTFTDILFGTVGSILAVTTAIGALGFAMKAFSAFKIGGFAGLKTYVIENTIALQTFGKFVKLLVLEKFFSTTWWKGVGNNITSFFDIGIKGAAYFKASWLALGKVFTSGHGIVYSLKYLTQSIILFGSATVFSFGSIVKNTIGGVTKITAATGLLEASFSLLATLMTGGFKAAGVALKFLWTSLAPLLAIGLKFAIPIAAIGALGIFFFGPGHNFVDNVTWAYDKLRELFGLQPKTKQGRLSDLLGKMGPQNIAGGMVDFSAQIKNIDFEKMTAPQFSVLKDVSERTLTSLKDLDAIYIEQGRLSDEQLAQYKQTLSEFSKMTGKMPQLENVGLAKDMEDLANRLDSADLSTRAFAKYLLGINPLMGTLAVTAMSLGQALGDALDALFKIIKISLSVGLVGAIGAGIMAFFAGSAATIAAAAAFPAAVAVGALVGLIYTAFESYWPDTAKRIAELLSSGIEKYTVFGKDNIVNGSIKLAGVIVKGYFDSVNKKFKENQEALITPEARASAEKLRNTGIPENIQYAQPVFKKNFEDVLKRFSDAEYNKSMFKGGYNSPARNAVKATSEADFAKKYAEAVSEFNAAQKLYGETVDKFAPIFAEDKAIAKFTDRVTLFDKSVKELLGIDFGDKTKDFFGTAADWKAFEDHVEQARTLQIKLDYTTSVEQLGKINIDKAQNAARAAAYQAAVKGQVEQKATIEGLLGSQATAVGGEQYKASIMQLQKASSDAYQDFKKLTDSVGVLQNKLLDLDPTVAADVEMFHTLQKQIRALQNQAIAALPTNNWFDSVNEKLQTINADQLSIFSYKELDTSGLKSLGEDLNNLIKTQKEYNDAKQDNPEDFKGLMEKLNIINELTEKIKTNTKELNLKALQSAASSLVSPKQKAKKFAELGQAIPTEVMAKGLTDPYTAMIVKRNQLQLQVETGKLPVTTSLEEANQQLLSYDLAMSKMAEITVTTLSSLLSSFSDLGVAIDSIGFSRLDSDSRAFLTNVGSQLESISKTISETPYSEALLSLVQTQETLLLSAADALLKASYKTGAGISSALGRLGLSENNTIANLNRVQLDNLLEMDKAAEKAKILASRASNPEDYLKRLKEQARATIRGTQQAESMANSFDKNISNLNEVFKTSLDGFDATTMSPQIISSAMDIARELKNELEIAISENQPTADLFEKLRSAELIGGFITLFKDLGKGLRDAIVGGAEAGFDKIKSAYSESQMTFKQYAELDPSRRRQRSQEATYQEAFRKAANMELSPEQAKILNRVGSGEEISKVMQDFEKQFGDMLTKSDNPIVVSQDNLKKSVDALKEAIDIERKDKQITSDIASGKISQREGIDQLNTFVSNINKSKDIIPTEFSKDKGVGNLTAKTLLMAKEASNKKKEFEDLGYLLSQANFKGVLDAADGFGRETMNLASDAQLKQAAEIKVKLAGLQAEMADATLNKLDTQTLQKKIDNYTDELGRIPYAIDYLRNAIREAGVNMRDTVDTTFRGAFTDLLKGKAAEGESAFSTFTNTLMEGISNSVVDTFAKGITDRITGPGSLIAGAAQSMGEGIYDIFGNVLDGLSSMFSSEASSKGGGILDSITGFFSNIFSTSTSKATAGQPVGGGFGGGLGASGGLFGGLSGIFGGGDTGGMGGSNGCCCDTGAAGALGKAGDLFKGANGGLNSEGIPNLLARPEESMFSGITDSLTKTFSGLFGEGGSITTMFSGFGKGLMDVFGGLASSIMDMLGGLGGALGGVGGSIMSGLSFLADGGVAGQVKGIGTGTSDSIPAMLSNGEFVINAKATKENLKLLNAINSGNIPKFATGGLVNNIPSVTLNDPKTLDTSKLNNEKKSSNSQVVNLTITGDISRQTKSEIYKMLPDIAQGVNMHNKEKGYKG